MNGPVRLLADTQIVIWYVTQPDRLTASATRAIEEATERDEAVGVLAFALVEMIYAVEKTTNRCLLPRVCRETSQHEPARAITERPVHRA